MSSYDDKYRESLEQLIETINYNSFLKSAMQSQDNAESATQNNAGIQKSKEEEWMEKRQGIVSAEITQNGALLLKITFKAAGFIIGDKGSSIRSICSRTGASSNSWTCNIQMDGEMQAVRVCKIVGEDSQVLFNTLRIVKAAADRYDELIQGVCKEKFVAKTQIVEGIRFEYKPPPLKLVSTATRTFKAPTSREQGINFGAAPTDFFSPRTQSYQQPLQAVKAVPPLVNPLFSPRHVPPPTMTSAVYTRRTMQPPQSPFVTPRMGIDYYPPSQLITPRQNVPPSYPHYMPTAPIHQMSQLQVTRAASTPNIPTPRQYPVSSLSSVQSIEAVNQYNNAQFAGGSNTIWQQNYVAPNYVPPPYQQQYQPPPTVYPTNYPPYYNPPPSNASPYQPPTTEHPPPYPM